MNSVERTLHAVEDAAREIRSAIDHEAARDVGDNPSGETQKAADVQADDVLREHLGSVDAVGWYASEENSDVVDVGGGEYSVSVDPLDGSSNLESNNIVGSIVGVYDERPPTSKGAVVGAAYVVYGPRTTVVGARDGTVTEKTLETEETKRVSLPEPTVYGFGGRRPEWTDGFEAYAAEVEAELKLRYGGAMVGDVNQVLHKGGVFAYPGLRDRPEGKLRLQFEGVPMAYVVETAGGMSSDGEKALLERDVEHLHERTPVYLGDTEYVERAERALSTAR
ncbi:MAG: class 1 fructose-bisphosphatase [Halobacteriota archaeon]